MVKIRLRRTGAKKKPHYRVVAADSRAPRDGRFIEILGHYNPRTEPVTFSVHEDRVLHWLSVGAQPTDTVKKLLENMGMLDKFASMKGGVALDQIITEAKTNAVESAEQEADAVGEAEEEAAE